MLPLFLLLFSLLNCMHYSSTAILEDIEKIENKAALLNVSSSEFDYSFLTRKSYNPKIIPNLALSGEIPAIGVYATPYELRKRLALIQSDPKRAASSISRPFAEQLLNQLGYSVQDALETVSPNAPENIKTKAIHDFLGQILESMGTNVTFNIALWGASPAPNNMYNIAFHPVVSNWLYENNTLVPGVQWINSPLDPKIRYPRYNVNMPAGLFDPKGVEVKPGSNSIAFNTFSLQNIITHASNRADYYDDMSPNNVHFGVTPNRKISSFWTALFSPKKEKLALTFNILINDQALEEALEKELLKAHTPQTFIALVSSTLFNLLKTNPQDTTTLQEALATIKANMVPDTTPQTPNIPAITIKPSSAPIAPVATAPSVPAPTPAVPVISAAPSVPVVAPAAPTVPMPPIIQPPAPAALPVAPSVPTVPVITPIIPTSAAAAPAIQDDTKFNYSFLTQKAFTPQIIPNLALTAGVPAMGAYGPPFNPRNRLALIQSDAKRAAASMPRQFAEQLLTHLGFSVQDALATVPPNAPEKIKAAAISTVLGQLLESMGNNVTFTIALWGASPSPDGIDSIAFQPVVSNWLYENKNLVPNTEWITNPNDPNSMYPRYNVTLSAGLFDPRGIDEKSGINPITFNKFGLQNIVTQAGNSNTQDALSPDSVRFGITAKRKASSFWIALFAPNNSKLALTFNMLINDKAIADKFELELKQKLSRARTPQTFFSTLWGLAINLIAYDSQGATALQQALYPVMQQHKS